MGAAWFRGSRKATGVYLLGGSVTLGSGKPLLPRQITSPSLKLVSVQRFGEGFAKPR